MVDALGLTLWTGFTFGMGWLAKAFVDACERRHNEKNKVWKPSNRRNR